MLAVEARQVALQLALRRRPPAFGLLRLELLLKRGAAPRISKGHMLLEDREPSRQPLRLAQALAVLGIHCQCHWALHAAAQII